MKISLGTDHAGFEVKNNIINFLKSLGHEVIDCGTFSKDSCDYPDFAKEVAMNIINGKSDKGVLICGTGIGMAIAANKIKGIRAGVCWNVETARLISLHNNANIICLGARFLYIEEMFDMIKMYLETKFEERHSKRILKISEMEK
ncbi:MAG: ribose 5-phosphate isomerase B [Endomicrobiaceae bacterium]|jgi:ribose 5-phosphate isomerase B|nr:ribose 5-phosphate isomerase B [Endomicrobiaceae bacterium]MDD3729580.1 ribose 5-phosphate isomerase B [Endomicrobiaceae bacterium]MDD4165480.1 ribose 5-phosphate isomerase B [Endomicrobiaceae bacterium]